MISEMTSERFATLEYECSDLMSYTQIQMTLKNSRIANTNHRYTILEETYYFNLLKIKKRFIYENIKYNYILKN